MDYENRKYEEVREQLILFESATFITEEELKMFCWRFQGLLNSVLTSIYYKHKNDEDDSHKTDMWWYRNNLEIIEEAILHRDSYDDLTRKFLLTFLKKELECINHMIKAGEVKEVIYVNKRKGIFGLKVYRKENGVWKGKEFIKK